MHPDSTPSSPSSSASSTTSRSRRPRGTILGVSAGVLGGGLVGLAMTVPTFTSAASEDTDDAVVAALQDTDTDTDTDTGTDDTDTDTDDTGTDTDIDGERPDRGARLRESLQELVDDGTLTSEQADAVATHLATQMPDRAGHGRGGPGRRPGFDGEVVAELLSIDASELRSSLRDGQTIAELAAANGVDVQDVIDALVAEVQSHLDLAVENGRLTEEEAAERLAEATERITARVTGESIDEG